MCRRDDEGKDVCREHADGVYTRKEPGGRRWLPLDVEECKVQGEVADHCQALC
jgi:hypothetical protein